MSIKYPYPFKALFSRHILIHKILGGPLYKKVDVILIFFKVPFVIYHGSIIPYSRELCGQSCVHLLYSVYSIVHNCVTTILLANLPIQHGLLPRSRSSLYTQLQQPPNTLHVEQIGGWPLIGRGQRQRLVVGLNELSLEDYFICKPQAEYECELRLVVKYQR